MDWNSNSRVDRCMRTRGHGVAFASAVVFNPQGDEND